MECPECGAFNRSSSAACALCELQFGYEESKRERDERHERLDSIAARYHAQETFAAAVLLGVGVALPSLSACYTRYVQELARVTQVARETGANLDKLSAEVRNASLLNCLVYLAIAIACGVLLTHARDRSREAGWAALGGSVCVAIAAAWSFSARFGPGLAMQWGMEWVLSGLFLCFAAGLLAVAERDVFSPRATPRGSFPDGLLVGFFVGPVFWVALRLLGRGVDLRRGALVGASMHLVLLWGVFHFAPSQVDEAMVERALGK